MVAEAREFQALELDAVGADLGQVVVGLLGQRCACFFTLHHL